MTAADAAEKAAPFPVGGYSVCACGDQLVAFGGWTMGAAKKPSARPQTAPAAGARSATGARPTNAVHAFDMASERWRELPSETTPPPARAGHAGCATGDHCCSGSNGKGVTVVLGSGILVVDVVVRRG